MPQIPALRVALAGSKQTNHEEELGTTSLAYHSPLVHFRSFRSVVLLVFLLECVALLERVGIFYPSELVLCQDVVFLGVQVFDFYGPFLSLVKGAFDPPNRVVSCQGVRAREQACAPLKWHLGEPRDLGVSCRCEIKSVVVTAWLNIPLRRCPSRYMILWC